MKYPTQNSIINMKIESKKIISVSKAVLDRLQEHTILTKDRPVQEQITEVLNDYDFTSKLNDALYNELEHNATNDLWRQLSEFIEENNLTELTIVETELTTHRNMEKQVTEVELTIYFMAGKPFA